MRLKQVITAQPFGPCKESANQKYSFIKLGASKIFTIFWWLFYCKKINFSINQCACNQSVVLKLWTAEWYFWMTVRKCYHQSKKLCRSLKLHSVSWKTFIHVYSTFWKMWFVSSDHLIKSYNIIDNYTIKNKNEIRVYKTVDNKKYFQNRNWTRKNWTRIFEHRV